MGNRELLAVKLALVATLARGSQTAIIYMDRSQEPSLHPNGKTT